MEGYLTKGQQSSVNL